jgi:hypothetical protein
MVGRATPNDGLADRLLILVDLDPRSFKSVSYSYKHPAIAKRVVTSPMEVDLHGISPISDVN